MFLRANKRYKDGKAHRNWNPMESVRAGRLVFQRQVLYHSGLHVFQLADRRHSFKDELFHFLCECWTGLFGSTFDVVLFDLTSTYFEVNGTKGNDSDL